MGATTSLGDRLLSVAPGQSASCSIQIRNSGTVVDQFTVDVVGDARQWARVEPPSVNLLPRQEATVVVTFTVPQDATEAAGDVPFGIRVLSSEDPQGSVVEEGVLNVAPRTDMSVELVPRTAKCRSKARFQLAIDNRGNHPTPVEVLISEPDEELTFRVSDPELVLQPATTAFVKVQARPLDRFLRGPDRRFPFQVTVMTPDGTQHTADGAVVQRALLPKWLLPALLALLALAAIMVALWFTVIRPTVKSAARDAAVQVAQEKQKELSAEVNKAAGKADEANKKAAQVEQKVDNAAANPNGGGGKPVVVGPDGVDISKGDAFDRRVTTDVPANATDDVFTTFDFDPLIPDDKALVLTDVFLQNPRGDAGLIQIRRKSGDEEVVLYEAGLNNFRDLDVHTVSEWVLAKGQSLIVAVDCDNDPARNCTPAVSFVGRLSK